MPSRDGARSQAKERTRAALVDAARREFVEKGLHAPSLDAICARAGYTRGAFYVHFDDREGLVAAVMEDTLGEILDRVIADAPDAGGLEEIVLRYVRLAAAAPSAESGDSSPAFAIPLHQMLEACGQDERVRRRFVSVLQNAAAQVASVAHDAQQEGTARNDVGAEEMGRVLILMALGVRFAAEVGLAFDLKSTRGAVLDLLKPPEAPAREASAAAREPEEE